MRIESRSACGRIVEWEIVLSTKDVHHALRELSDDRHWQAALPDLLDDFSRLLRDALDLMQELGGADNTSDHSCAHQPSIEKHPQNRGFQEWTALIDLTRDAWRAAAAESPVRARLVAEAWRHVPYPLFRRLTFFAAAHTEIVPRGLGFKWLLEDESWWLWSEQTTRESIRLLVALVPLLDEAEQAKLETAVLAGPPDTMLEGLESDLYTYRVHLASRAQSPRPGPSRPHLPPAVQRRLEDPARVRPQSPMARWRARHHHGAPHLGAEPRAAHPCPLPRHRRRLEPRPGALADLRPVADSSSPPPPSRRCSAASISTSSPTPTAAANCAMPGDEGSDDTRAFECLKNALRSNDWVVYSKAPFAGAAHVLAYLGRYTHKSAIANHRLVDFDAEHVRSPMARLRPRQQTQDHDAPRRRVHPTLPPARAPAPLHPAAPLRIARQSRTRSKALPVPNPCSLSPSPNRVSRKLPRR